MPVRFDLREVPELADVDPEHRHVLDHCGPDGPQHRAVATEAQHEVGPDGQRVGRGSEIRSTERDRVVDRESNVMAPVEQPVDALGCEVLRLAAVEHESDRAHRAVASSIASPIRSATDPLDGLATAGRR